jgi:hypothetical protein
MGLTSAQTDAGAGRCFLALALLHAAGAQGYPNRPIRVASFLSGGAVTGRCA